MSTLRRYAGANERLELNDPSCLYGMGVEVFCGRMTCNVNGCHVVPGTLSFVLGHDPLWVICRPCLEAKVNHWYVGNRRDEKARIEAQEHPSQARIAELNGEIEAAIARASVRP